MKIAILNPGAMGVTIGACAVANGHQVFWCSNGRSQETQKRVVEQCPEMIEVESVQLLANQSEVIISVCPPHAAHDVAKQIQELKQPFRGIYIDANAVSPDTLRQIHETLRSTSSINFLDASIIGPPALKQGTTRLYISGSASHCKLVQEIYQGSNLEVILVNENIGSASALKMAYAAYHKGTSALILSILALAKKEGVTDLMLQEWNKSNPELAKRYESSVLGSLPKAWRFVGEMKEIAHTFEISGLSPNFHIAAADTFSKLSQVADQLRAENEASSLETILTRFLSLCPNSEP